MNELTIEIDCWIHKEFKDYLLSLNGVYEVNIEDKENLIINIKYDSNLMKLKILKLEILLFLGILHTPCVISFDKHCKNKTEEYEIIIKDLCCEYCLKGMIDDLFSIDGVEKACCNLEKVYESPTNQKDIIINISYDPKLISIEEIRKIELNFNS